MVMAIFILLSSAVIWLLAEGVVAWLAAGVFLFVVAAVVNGYFAAGADRSVGTAKKLPGNGRYSWEVVGESHYQDNLERLAGPKTYDGVEHYCTALIRHEPANEHDENACEVRIESMTVGYLPRANAAKLVNLVGKSGFAFTAQAVIRGGWRRDDDDEGHYGVSLDVAAGKLKDSV
tara:strand:- start:3871 stop:4398 length:528 start_codon:yes stop_codon:yes gene_type:complete